MAEFMPTQSKNNPLSKYFRQPKIYIRLPSNGEFYPPGALDKSTNDEYAVYAMTAKDELIMKTPDALLSGQSTVEVIKSCIPAIKDPWKMPTLDVDAALLSIRIATYGENMDVTSTCPKCDTANDYVVNLTELLGKVSRVSYEPTIIINDLTVHIRPYSYQEMSKAALKTFEQQRIFQVINDENIDNEKKLSMFNESFLKLTELTVDIIAGCIRQIDTPEGSVSDPKMIKDFIDNCPKELFDQMQDHIKQMKTNNELAPMTVKCSSCSHDYQQPVAMDQASFFGSRS